MRSRDMLVIAHVGAALVAVACGSFTGDATDAGSPDGSIADAASPMDASTGGPDATALDGAKPPQDGGSTVEDAGVDAPIVAQDGGAADLCGSGDPLAVPGFGPNGTAMACAAGAMFIRWCRVTAFGDTRSISFDETETRTAVTFNGNVRLYLRDQAGIAPKLKGFLSPNTPYAALSPNGTKMVVETLGVGDAGAPRTFDVDFDAGTATPAMQSALPIVSAQHISHPFWAMTGTKYVTLWNDNVYDFAISYYDNNALNPAVIQTTPDAVVGSAVTDGLQELFYFQKANNDAGDNTRQVYRAAPGNAVGKWAGGAVLDMPVGFGATSDWQPQWLSADRCRLYITRATGTPEVRVLSRR